jgi:glycine cleavage system H protein
VVESVKAASDIYAPVSGEVTAVDEQVVASPEMINADAYGHWLFKLKPDNAAGVASLLDAAAYIALVGED